MGKRTVGLEEDYADIVGMPDGWDRKNIETLINVFKSTMFTVDTQDGKKVRIKGDTLIKQCVIDAYNYHSNSLDLSGAKGLNLKSKESDLRAVMTMPIALDAKLRQGYPTLFKGKHLQWFLRNFPEFKISREKM